MEKQANNLLIDDPLRNAPHQYHLMLENERVRVLEYRSKPGDKSAMHWHPDCIVYSFTPATLLITTLDGGSQEVDLKTGELIWRSETTHALENVGITEAHLLVIELKVPVEAVPLV